MCEETGKIFGMNEENVISAEQAAQFTEFQRLRRRTEVELTLKKLVIDASRRETDKHALFAACECAKKLRAGTVAVSPVNVAAAKKKTRGGEIGISCLVGGTGESVISIKKAEAKKAVRQGATEIKLVPCYSALTGGNYAYLKREVKRLRRTAKKCVLTVSLEDSVLSEEEVSLGVRAAREGGADGVCVRGELPVVERAVKEGAKLAVTAAGVENAEQLRLCIKAGASRAVTCFGEQIAGELYLPLQTV